MQITNLVTPHLRIADWQIRAGECWAVLGRNGSGKRHLAGLLTGATQAESGSLTHNWPSVDVLSFEAQQAFYEQELRNDDSDFIDYQDPGTTVASLLNLSGAVPARLAFLKLEPLLQRGYRQLSSGEARKALLARAVLQEPALLILDEPFDSLDIASKQHLAEFFAALLKEGRTSLLFVLNTVEEVFPWHTHLALLDKGQLLAAGPRATMLADSAVQALLQFDSACLPPWPAPLFDASPPSPLVELHQGRVSYGDKLIFSNIELQIEPGDHTLITGPNGAGKSTLLNLITGDHPQCYGNDLTLFGRKRGTGESIWELKRRIGIVSPGLHRDHRVAGSALEIVLSGFFDSIGLYDRTTSVQEAHARHWLALTGLSALAEVPFKLLSYGEQRLVLVARALIKQPALVVLDEPTQGLDDVNRHRVMVFLEHLTTQRQSTIVMASHRLDEHLPLFTSELRL